MLFIVVQAHLLDRGAVTDREAQVLTGEVIDREVQVLTGEALTAPLLHQLQGLLVPIRLDQALLQQEVGAT